MLIIILKESYNIYKDFISEYLPDWDTYSKNELILKASTASGIYKDVYVVGIILKYWNKLDKYYYRDKLVATPEDIHTWLVKAIDYTLKHKPWENPTSSLFNDKNAQDKVLNRCIESVRLTYYQQLNRYNRKMNNLIISLDDLTEDYKDACTPITDDQPNVFYSDIIKGYFLKKEYIKAFIIDIIINEYDFNNDFNAKKLINILKNIDASYIKKFANLYDINIEEIEKGYQSLMSLSNIRLKKLVNVILLQLKSELRRFLL